MDAEPDGPLDGTWELVRAEMGGATASELIAMGVELRLSRGEYTVRFGGEISDRGTFEVSEITEPKSMLLRGVEGPNAGRTIPCIYQRMRDRLRVCYGLDGTAPAAFATGAGSPRYLGSYRRIAQA